MLAFSTCWNNSRHTDGEAMIAEIVELGFSHIELSHGMTIAKLPGIRMAFERGMFTCAGVHNYFPSPVEVMIDAPDAYQFTSHRQAERQRALDMTLRTLELAAEFRAGYLVLHMGSVPMNPAKWTKPLTAAVAAGRSHERDFIRRKTDFVKKREKTGPLYYSRAIEALETIAGHAAELRIKLAIESRSRFEDMPTEREMLALQEHFADHPWVGYWHDFGHVQLKHNLGLLDHTEWLERIAPRLIGGHVHDVEWPARDHRVPFCGTLDYAALLPFFPPGCPLVWELSPGRDAGEIRRALARWRSEFPDRGCPPQSARGFPQNRAGKLVPPGLLCPVMNATEIAELRERLIKERERIVAEWENHGGDGSPTDDWNTRDVEERAVQIASEVVERRIALDDSNLLRKVDFALKRMAEGTYQQCENCGATIPLGRLIAKPSVSLCLACQEAKDSGRL